MADYDHFFAQLTAVSASIGQIVIAGEGGSARGALRTANGRTLVFEGTADDLVRAVAATDAEGLYPEQESSSLPGKLKLFSIHLEEALDTAPEGARLLSLRSYGVVAV